MSIILLFECGNAPRKEQKLCTAVIVSWTKRHMIKHTEFLTRTGYQLIHEDLTNSKYWCSYCQYTPLLQIVKHFTRNVVKQLMDSYSDS